MNKLSAEKRREFNLPRKREEFQRKREERIREEERARIVEERDRIAMEKRRKAEAARFAAAESKKQNISRDEDDETVLDSEEESGHEDKVDNRGLPDKEASVVRKQSTSASSER
ncbi:hypothetical protein M413DRAFT_24922 [Hebeloma cylindrosporum]|uniref:Uncharacterized protein n=1 Tax=Hebeloma cylindrosporum TaxID=76867 RepID=A0A0C3CKV3_HEBCY|nr:hypothetical protein M413DRAFT_24922 [Hebeloma cylindrosporum h7]